MKRPIAPEEQMLSKYVDHLFLQSFQQRDFSSSNLMQTKTRAAEMFKISRFSDSQAWFCRALDLMQMFLDAKEEISSLYSGKAIADFFLKDYSASIEACRSAIENDPYRWSPYLCLAFTFCHLSNPTLQRDCLEKFAHLFSENSKHPRVDEMLNKVKLALKSDLQTKFELIIEIDYFNDTTITHSGILVISPTGVTDLDESMIENNQEMVDPSRDNNGESNGEIDPGKGVSVDFNDYGQLCKMVKFLQGSLERGEFSGKPMDQLPEYIQKADRILMDLYARQVTNTGESETAEAGSPGDDPRLAMRLLKNKELLASTFPMLSSLGAIPPAEKTREMDSDPDSPGEVSPSRRPKEMTTSDEPPLLIPVGESVGRLIELNLPSSLVRGLSKSQLFKAAAEAKEKGNLAFKNNDLSLALECYTFAIRLDPENNVFYCNRALVYLKLGRFEETITDCTASIDRKDWIKPYNHRAKARLALRQFELALQDFQKAVEFEPNNLTCNEDYLDCLLTVVRTTLENNVSRPGSQKERFGKCVPSTPTTVEDRALRLGELQHIIEKVSKKVKLLS